MRCHMGVLIGGILLAAPAFAKGMGTTATTHVRDADGRSVGTVVVREMRKGLRVRAKIRGLPNGVHAIHLHEVGRCDPPEFMSAGAHFNPFGKQHGAKNPHGSHAGDLPNVFIRNGVGSIAATIPDVTLHGSGVTLLDADGAAVVVHMNRDDEKSEPAGASGPRIACGVIEKK